MGRRARRSIRDFEDMMLSKQMWQTHAYYKGRLIDLALSQFEYHGLPDTVDRRHLEKTLLFNGTAIWYWPVGVEFPMVAAWATKSGMFDAYGYPTSVVAIDFNGRQIDTDDFIIVYDNNQRTSLMSYIDLHALRLTQAQLTADNNLMQQNTPYLLSTDKDSLLSIRNIMKKVFMFDPAIEINTSLGDRVASGEAIQKVDLDVPLKVNDIAEYRRQLWAEAISMLGIASETTKKERMITGEIALNRQEDSITLNSRLLQRVELVNTLNENYGYDIEVNMSDVVIQDAGMIPGLHQTPQEPSDG